MSASSSSDDFESEVETPKKVKTKKAPAPVAKVQKKTKSRPEPPSVAEPSEHEKAPVLRETDVKTEPTAPSRPCSPPPKMPSPRPPPSPAPAAPAPPPPPPPPPPCLTQDTHSSFFALLREVSINNDGPLSVKQFVDSIVVWSSSPITPLNEWYNEQFNL